MFRDLTNFLTDFSRYYCNLAQKHLIVEELPYDESVSSGLNSTLMLGNEIAGGQITKRKIFIPDFDGLQRYEGGKNISIPYSSIVSVDLIRNLGSFLVCLAVGSGKKYSKLYYSATKAINAPLSERNATIQLANKISGLIQSGS